LFDKFYLKKEFLNPKKIKLSNQNPPMSILQDMTGEKFNIGEYVIQFKSVIVVPEISQVIMINIILEPNIYFDEKPHFVTLTFQEDEEEMSIPALE
jgi:hypothetical protein